MSSLLSDNHVTVHVWWQSCVHLLGVVWGPKGTFQEHLLLPDLTLGASIPYTCNHYLFIHTTVWALGSLLPPCEVWVCRRWGPHLVGVSWHTLQRRLSSKAGMSSFSLCILHYRPYLSSLLVKHVLRKDIHGIIEYVVFSDCIASLSMLVSLLFLWSECMVSMLISLSSVLFFDFWFFLACRCSCKYRLNSLVLIPEGIQFESPIISFL